MLLFKLTTSGLRQIAVFVGPRGHPHPDLDLSPSHLEAKKESSNQSSSHGRIFFDSDISKMPLFQLTTSVIETGHF